MPTPMTKQGHEQMKAELEQLKTIDRPTVIADIAEARAHGDLKENAEYHAAREQQGFIEGRIREVEAKLSDCQVIDVLTMKNTGTVIFGTTVTIVNAETGERVTYQIVGEDEANITQGKVSVTSPVARALIGKKAEDEVEVITPQGVVAYEIEKVEYV